MLGIFIASRQCNSSVPARAGVFEWRKSVIFDNRQAISEGWDLFDVEGRIQLQKIDDPSVLNDLDAINPLFPSDADALIWVALRAANGSVYHRGAIERIGTLSR